jgi:hypothetical protein
LHKKGFPAAHATVDDKQIVRNAQSVNEAVAFPNPDDYPLQKTHSPGSADFLSPIVDGAIAEIVVSREQSGQALHL